MFRKNLIKGKVALFLVIAGVLGFLVAANEQATAAVPPGCPLDMTHYWQLEESASPYIDFYGGNSATCTNCPTATTGIVGGAQQFTLTSNVTVPVDGTFDWGVSANFSIEFWMKTDPASTCSGNQVIAGIKGSSGSLMWVGCLDGGTPEFELYDTAGNGISIGGTTDLTDGNWHHVVAVRDADANQLLLYLDGNLVGSAPVSYPAAFDLSAPLDIGWLNLNGGFHFVGAIDDVALYNRALTAREVRSHYYLARSYCDMCTTPVNIMPTGDSITQGYNSTLSLQGNDYMASYRQQLYSDLKGAGYDFDFVGSLQSGNLLLPSFDTHNEGHPGETLSCSLPPYGSVVNDINSWLTAANGTPPGAPEVILLHIGTNDVANSCANPGDIATVLDNIDSFSKNITVLLARIINQQTPTSAVTNFNDAVQAIAQTRIAGGDKIIMVDEEHALTYPGDMDSILHPTQTGYDKMAGPWFDALNTFLPVCGEVAPVIYSTPSALAVVGQQYNHYVQATGNPMPSYNLTVAPPGMTIIPETGLIKWVPSSAGTSDVTVTAGNTKGSDTKSFSIESLACPSDMSHYWQLEESASPYIDFYGGNSATCTNCPTPTTGIIGGAQQFTLTSNVTVPADGTFDWGVTDNFSIEFWMKTDPASTCSGNQVIAGIKGSSGGLLWIGCLDGGTPEFELYDTAGNGISIGGTTDLTDGNWHHVVAVRNAGVNQILIYVDGSFEKSASTSTSFSAPFDLSTALDIGWLNWNEGYHFAGAIDEVALYNRALTDAEVQQHYANRIGNNGYCYGYQVVTPSAGVNGNISPSTLRTVLDNGTTAFTITPNFGYHIESVTGCGGTLTGNTYNTAPITGDCTITAIFEINDVVKRISGATSAYYPALQTAYDAAANGDTLQSQATTLDPELNFGQDIDVSLIGGYNVDFSSQTGNTTVGKVTISKGTVIMGGGIVIQ